jgi:pilus assembly protein Flp/PilA
MFSLPLFIHLKNCFLKEDGQDLVEYALLVALLSFCAIAAMQNLATGITSAFGGLATTFNADV